MHSNEQPLPLCGLRCPMPTTDGQCQCVRQNLPVFRVSPLYSCAPPNGNLSSAATIQKIRNIIGSHRLHPASHTSHIASSIQQQQLPLGIFCVAKMAGSSGWRMFGDTDLVKMAGREDMATMISLTPINSQYPPTISSTGCRLSMPMPIFAMAMVTQVWLVLTDHKYFSCSNTATILLQRQPQYLPC